ncbi:hypothetical protein H4R34_004659, partial [Dimargaris verticillata]
MPRHPKPLASPSELDIRRPLPSRKRPRIQPKKSGFLGRTLRQLLLGYLLFMVFIRCPLQISPTLDPNAEVVCRTVYHAQESVVKPAYAWFQATPYGQKAEAYYISRVDPLYQTYGAPAVNTMTYYHRHYVMPWGEQAYYRILVPLGQHIEQYYHEYAHPWVGVAWAKVYPHYEQMAKPHVDVALAWFWHHYYTTQVFFHGQVNPRLRHSMDTVVHTYRTHVAPKVVTFYQNRAVPFYHHRVRPAAQQAAAYSVHVYHTYALPYSARTYQESLRLAKHIHKTYVVPGSAAAYNHAYHFTTTVVAPYVHRQYRTYLGPHVDCYVDWDQVEAVHSKACAAARVSKQWLKSAVTVATQYMVQGYKFNRQLWAQYMGVSEEVVSSDSKVAPTPEQESAPQAVSDQLAISAIPTTTRSATTTPVVSTPPIVATTKASAKPTQSREDKSSTMPVPLNTRSSSRLGQTTPTHPDLTAKADADPMPPKTARSPTTATVATTSRQTAALPVVPETVHVVTTLPSAATGAQVVEPNRLQTTSAPIEPALTVIDVSESLSASSSSTPASAHSPASPDSARSITAASHLRPLTHSRLPSASPSSSQALTRPPSTPTSVVASANLEPLSSSTALSHSTSTASAAELMTTTATPASVANSSSTPVSAAATTSSVAFASTQSKPPIVDMTTAVPPSSVASATTQTTQATATESIR